MGDSANDVIVAAQNVNTGKACGVLDLSATTLVNIAQVRGTSANDDITGSKGADTIDAGDGDDTLRESGGADVVDGGAGINIFVAKNAVANYTAGYINADGTKSYNNGASWKLVDNTGNTIVLTNIQSVQFSDQTFSSSTTNEQSSGSSGKSARMRFIASDAVKNSPASVTNASAVYKPEIIQTAAATATPASDYVRSSLNHTRISSVVHDGGLSHTGPNHGAVPDSLGLMTHDFHQALFHQS